MYQKSFIVIVFAFLVAACSAATPTATEVPQPIPTTIAPTSITEGEVVSVCWDGNVVKMSLSGEAVRVSAEGFTYESKSGVQMTRENISVQVDSVKVSFVASGVGDNLDLVVNYTSAGDTASFKLGETGQCLGLEPVKK